MANTNDPEEELNISNDLGPFKDSLFDGFALAFLMSPLLNQPDIVMGVIDQVAPTYRDGVSNKEKVPLSPFPDIGVLTHSANAQTRFMTKEVRPRIDRQTRTRLEKYTSIAREWLASIDGRRYLVDVQVQMTGGAHHYAHFPITQARFPDFTEWAWTVAGTKVFILSVFGPNLALVDTDALTDAQWRWLRRLSLFHLRMEIHIQRIHWNYKREGQYDEIIHRIGTFISNVHQTMKDSLSNVFAPTPPTLQPLPLFQLVVEDV